MIEGREVTFTLTDIYALETSWMMPLNLPNHRIDAKVILMFGRKLQINF